MGSRLVGGSLKRDSRSVKVQMSIFAVSIFTGKRRVSRKTFTRFFGAGGDENTSEKPEGRPPVLRASGLVRVFGMW